MAASESFGHRSSASSLAANSPARQQHIYRRSEPKPILFPSARAANSRRTRTSNGFSNTSNTSNTSNSTSNNTIGNSIGDVVAIKRLEPLGIEEYESNYRLGSTDFELIERVFLGSFESNQLRAALWPYLFGLIVHRGRFEKVHLQAPAAPPAPAAASPAANATTDGQTPATGYVFIEHEANAKRWLELEQLYLSYEGQWKAITRDQEERFSLFRERKALIGRDVIRCDRLHPFYAEQPRNLELLSSLLMTYMMFDFDIGYVQGMSDLAGPILYIFQGDLVKSFWVFVEVMRLVRRNFEHTQKSIHFQLSCLFELIRITDSKFAKYLEEQESSNCFFAFRAIVCQFKRELMKDDANYYDKCLQLWDTIWCVERRCVLEANLMAMNQADLGQSCSPVSARSPLSSTHQHLSHNHHHQHHHHQHHHHSHHNQHHNNHHHHHYGASWKSIPHYLTSFPSPLARSPVLGNAGAKWGSSGPATRDQIQPDTPRHHLTETEMFILALCLVMILRERDTILANRLDGNDIHLHFIEPKLAKDLNGFIQSAINTYRIMRNDLDLSRLTSPRRACSNGSGAHQHDSNCWPEQEADEQQQPPLAATLAPLINDRTSNLSSPNNSHINTNSPSAATTIAASCSNPLEEFHLGSPGSLEGYDFLNDFLIINRVPGR